MPKRRLNPWEMKKYNDTILFENMCLFKGFFRNKQYVLFRILYLFCPGSLFYFQNIYYLILFYYKPLSFASSTYFQHLTGTAGIEKKDQLLGK